jgi:hypothetical protein
VLTPSRDLWAGIAARIETPVVEITPGGRLDAFTGRRSARMNRVWMGLAAAGLVAVTATVTRQITKRSVVVAPAPVVATATQAPSAADTAPSGATAANTTATPAATLVSEKTAAEKSYDAEIKRLRAIVAERRSMLDTATVNVIDHNLKIIDDAIAQCRMALRKDPASRFLMQSLDDALTTKLQLLRTAASLPSRA